MRFRHPHSGKTHGIAYPVGQSNCLILGLFWAVVPNLCLSCGFRPPLELCFFRVSFYKKWQRYVAKKRWIPNIHPFGLGGKVSVRNYDQTITQKL